MKYFFRTELWRWTIKILEIAAIAAVMIAVVLFIRNAMSEEIRCWVMCQPDSYVTLREKPKQSSCCFGGATFGTELCTDGAIRNGYLHVIGLTAEQNEGWISAMYVVFDEPEAMDRTATVVSNGRLAVRKGIDGKIRKWLQPMETVRIICWSEEWCLTNYGYVMTEFLELDGDNR